MRSFAAAYGTNVIISSCSELDTGLFGGVSAAPSTATQDGNSVALVWSRTEVPVVVNLRSGSGDSVTETSGVEPNAAIWSA